MLERGPQNAREIAQALGVEKSQINPVLYSTLAAVAEIGENWRWSLRPDFRKAAADDRVADRTVRLLKYFRDCVALDEAGPSCNEFDLQDRLALPLQHESGTPPKAQPPPTLLAPQLSKR